MGEARGDLQALREHLAERDEPCPNCGYNLRGLTGGACPECNQALRLTVGLVEPKLAAFVAGVVGLGMSLRFCGLLLVWVGAMSLASPRRGPPMQDLIPLALGAAVSLAGLIAWTRGRRRWLGRMTPGTRWACAAGAFVVGMVCPAWFMATVN